jgi:hypothetical protein
MEKQNEKVNALEDKISIILRQTNYTHEEATQKLIDFNNDAILVIKNYFGINNNISTQPVKSINQEIYKQLRYKLDASIVDYNKKISEENVRLYDTYQK